ncbi:MAG: hypothetical protein Q9P01_16605 [Anaerolineae bacterium]|nr:hypothetical protein [Anaerolineae bacterium]
MKDGNRAGFVGTNTIRQNYSREGRLDYVVANDGHIYDAISSKPWSGEARVHVSIVNWSKGKSPVEEATLRYYDGTESTNGEEEKIKWREVILPDNQQRTFPKKWMLVRHKVLTVNTQPRAVFQGQTPGNTSAFTLHQSRS